MLTHAPDSPDRVLRPRIIGMVGRAGSGKTTAQKWFIHNHKQVLGMSFAAPIRQMVYELLRQGAPKDCTPSYAYYFSDEGREDAIPFLGGVTCRSLLQTLGTDWGRNIVHPDMWVGILATRFEARMNSAMGRDPTTTLRVAIDDVRFPNEVEFVQAVGGCLLRIARPEDIRPPETYAHASEQEDLRADLTIVNDGTVSDLHAQLAALWPPTVPGKEES